MTPARKFLTPRFRKYLLHGATGLLVAATVSAAAGTAFATIIPIELTPSDVGSSSSSTFSTLPTADPALFGITGSDIRKINFDTTPSNVAIASGTYLTNQYASIGVTMNSIQVSNSVYGGAASAPNATITPAAKGAPLIFTFSVPVVSFGAINTSPDADLLEFWSGPNGTGTLLYSFQDQGGTTSPNFNIDRFVGGYVTGTSAIQSVIYKNNTGNIELDEFIFSADPGFYNPGGPGYTGQVPEPSTFAAFGLGLLGLGALRRRKKRAN